MIYTCTFDSCDESIWEVRPSSEGGQSSLSHIENLSLDSKYMSKRCVAICWLYLSNTLCRVGFCIGPIPEISDVDQEFKKLLENCVQLHVGGDLKTSS